MYAVLANKTIHYVGTDKDLAKEIFESKIGASLVNVNTLSELASFYDSSTKAEETPFDGLSEAAERVLDMLDDLGVNERSVEEVVETLKDKGQSAVAEVRHLGIKGMQTVGESFVALGDLLKKASEETDETD